MLRARVWAGCVVMSVVLWGVVGVGQAFAGSAWWHMGSSSRPSVFQAGVEKSEVQEITVNAEEGFYKVERQPKLAEEEENTTALPPTASHEAVQEALEGPQMYGAGNVEVSGGEPDGEGTRHYLVTFKAGFGNRPVKLMAVESFAFLPLKGGKEEVHAVEVVKGASDGQVVVSASNLGEVPVSGKGAPVTVVDKLPAGLEAVSIEGFVWEGNLSSTPSMSCVLATLTCTFEGTVSPFEQVEVRVGVKVVGGGVSGELNEAVVSGGGVAEASVGHAVQFGGVTSFGVDEDEVAFENEGGAADTQAGSHPFQMTSTVALNANGEGQPAALAKDLNVLFPTGFIGNPAPFTHCTLQQFLTTVPGGEKLGAANECPAASALGVAQVTVNEPQFLGVRVLVAPVFNIEPSVGEPARFGFLLPGTPVFLDVSVRTGGDYGVTVHARNIAQVAGLLRSEVTIWGVPGDARHDSSRGFGCLEETRGRKVHFPCHPLEQSAPPAFLSLPTSCAGPMETSIEAASWADPGVFLTRSGEPMQTLDGCNRLSFEPSIRVSPDDQHGSSATGLTVGVHIPQEESLSANGLAEGEIKETTVVMPAGVVLNPAAGGGLAACSIEQIALEAPTASVCPDASKVATVEINTPILPNPIRGAAYVAAQNANPFGSLVALYVFAEDPVSGVRIKLAGEVRLDPVTGQITTTFKSPQAPFEDFKIHFFGGSRAPLATPDICQPYTTQASFAPWSGNPAVPASSTFEITSGPNGAACQSPLAFTPTLAIGSTNLQAGGLTPLSTSISREDGQQTIGSIKLHMPPGFSGLLANVALCGETQANQGTCPAQSLVGETSVSVGVGSTPFSVTGGKVYITGPYQGAPFGLAITTPAKAGPYDLGKGACDCDIVRAKLEIDPDTTQITITTDSEGPYKIPTILDGFPLQIRRINVLINRPGFTFNPTNCNPLQVNGTFTSSQNTATTLNIPFQVTNCAALKFTPTFKASTNGRTSKRNGASLTVHITYPKTKPGTEANIAQTKVELPKALPSRLTTLQKACLAATFNKNPAGCPPGSIIGHATVTTPILPVPLTGPVYFVSHGGEAFPSLTIVLKGYGITAHLTGTTFISKQGITSTTFKTLPDVPFNTFTLTLPQGPNSALAANGNLCKTQLTMPTTLTAQNGTQKHQNTKITTTNCPKKHHKHKTKPKHHTTKHK